MPVSVGDEFRYLNGNTYVITDAGPIVLTQCALCGTAASADLYYPASKVRCSGCLSRDYEMLPGQRIHELKQEYAARFSASLRRKPA